MLVLFEISTAFEILDEASITLFMFLISDSELKMSSTEVANSKSEARLSHSGLIRFASSELFSESEVMNRSTSSNSLSSKAASCNSAILSLCSRSSSIEVSLLRVDFFESHSTCTKLNRGLFFLEMTSRYLD